MKQEVEERIDIRFGDVRICLEIEFGRKKSGGVTSLSPARCTVMPKRVDSGFGNIAISF